MDSIRCAVATIFADPTNNDNNGSIGHGHSGDRIGQFELDDINDVNLTPLREEYSPPRPAKADVRCEFLRTSSYFRKCGVCKMIDGVIARLEVLVVEEPWRVAEEKEGREPRYGW